MPLPINTMKKYICILAGAALLAACEPKTDTTEPAASPAATSPPTTTETTSPATTTESPATTTESPAATSPAPEVRGLSSYCEVFSRDSPGEDFCCTDAD